MKDPIKTDDFDTLRFKRTAVKFLRRLPDNDIAIVNDQDRARALLLQECGMIELKDLTGGELSGKTVCYRLMRADLYLAYLDGVKRARQHVNVQSWIAIGISVLSLAASVTAIIISL